MAIKLDAGTVKRQDTYLIDPNEIIVKEELRGRKYAPTELDIIHLAISMLDPDIGQLQAVVARRLPDKKVQLTAGFTRTAAARLIRSGFEHDGVTYQDENFLIKVSIADCNDEVALRRNITENRERNICSDIDDAFNQERLRAQGDTDSDIARFYKCSPTQVGKLRKLLSLTSEEQELVHRGLLPTQVAIDLLDLEPTDRAEIIANCQSDSGKVKGSDVRSQLRDFHLADVDTDDPEVSSEADDIFGTPEKPQAPAVSITRSMREVKGYLNTRLEDENFEDFHDVVDTLLEYMAGNRTERQMDNAFRRLPLKKTRKAA